MRIIRRISSLVLAMGATSCGEPATHGGLASPVPAAKLHAMTTQAPASWGSELPRLVEQLDSDDPAVRLIAITALERATGETYGYRYYDNARAREAAIERWVGGVRDGSISLIAIARGPTDE